MFPGKRDLASSLVSYKRTNWTRDPYAKMCYTYLGVNSTPEDFAKIAEPIKEKLFLAGEHTMFEFLGTVNSAYISGIKAAERLIGIETQNLACLLICLFLISTVYQ